MRFFVLGNPENRRVTLFSESFEASGFGKPIVLSYLDVLKNNLLKEIDFSGSILRIESPGENFEVRKLLIAKGSTVAQYEGLPFISEEQAHALEEPSEIIHTRQWYLGFKALLSEIELELKKYPGASVMNHPSDIALMFDKKECQLHLKKRGVAVPEFYAPVTNYRQLLELMNVQKLNKVFIKPAHASSASGVIAFRISGDKQQAVTSIELKREDKSVRLFNSLKLKTYTDQADIETIIDLVLTENAIVEQWLNKATIDDQYFDLRVLVIAGDARHIVVRKSKQVITNLHLGNKRGNLEELLATIGEEKLAEVRVLAGQAAACFPDSLYCGIDILVGADRKSLKVLEVNAFGDLLPNVWHKDKNCYEAEIEALMNTVNP
jgi:glutathione synthase/RimK-type ligase-like ATP-grasp enzyme